MNIIVKIESSNICRGCMSQDINELQSIHDCNIWEVFSKCTYLQLEKDDGLPSTICSNCISKCYAWLQFKELCQKSDYFLRKNKKNTVKDRIKKESKEDKNLDTEMDSQENQHMEFVTLANYGTQTDYGIYESNEDINESHESSRESVNMEPKYMFSKFCNDKVMTKNSQDHNCFAVKQELIINMSDSSDNEKSDNCDSDNMENVQKICDKVQKPMITKKICPTCGKTFRKEERLESHINTEHLGLKAVTCNICNAGFSSLGNLKRHMITHSEINNKNHLCKECGKAFTFSSSLTKHMRIHANVRNFICDHCGKGFIHKTGLQSHLLTHMTETPYPCHECGKRFKTDGMLKIHLRRHSSMKKFVCSECEKMFSTSGELTTHSRVHSGIRPYSCKRCPKSFKTVSQLYVHIRGHTGERPFSCDLCSQTFTASEVLKYHRMIHTGEKPYICTVCKKSFRQRCALKTHMRTHN